MAAYASLAPSGADARAPEAAGVGRPPFRTSALGMEERERARLLDGGLCEQRRCHHH